MAFNFRKLSVLIVEDTAPMCKLLAEMLRVLDVGTVFKAPDGQKGFEIFCKESPDIVIADWHMEPMNGLELTRQIRRNPLSPNRYVPVILFTEYSNVNRVAEARDVGATEFLVKPFSATDLARRIAYLINKPRDFIESPNFFGPDRRRRNDPRYSGPFRRASDPKTSDSLHEVPIANRAGR